LAGGLNTAHAMKRNYFFLLLATSLWCNKLHAQAGGAYTVYEGDTIPYYSLPAVDIVAFLPRNASDDLKKYIKLRRDVVKAYPYAKIAAAELRYINDSVARMTSDREKKRFIKDQERIMKNRFERDLKNLTYTQGRILIKLIDRETGNTSYALVKELRGSFQAFFWQGLAKLFSANLKTEYDAEGGDKDMEQIVQAIERGELQTVRR
jgi:hypothetical protein